MRFNFFRSNEKLAFFKNQKPSRKSKGFDKWPTKITKNTLQFFFEPQEFVVGESIVTYLNSLQF